MEWAAFQGTASCGSQTRRRTFPMWPVVGWLLTAVVVDAQQHSCCTPVSHVASDLANCGGSRPVGAPFAGRSATKSKHGAVATASPLASEAGLQVLKDGGSAVDAAIAANLVLSVVEPMMCGPGGDLMALVWSEQDGKLFGYNGAGRAPGNVSLDTVRQLSAPASFIPSTGPVGVTVPGAPMGWCDLHERFGKLNFSRLFDRAIEYAQNGFPVSDVIAHEWQAAIDGIDTDEATSHGRYPHALDAFKATFGSGPSEVFSNPALASTLRELAEQGCDAFYRNGSIADQLAAARDVAGVLFDAQDLAEHRGEWIEPINVTYRNRYRIFELPPNPQGAAALQMLNILEGYDLKGWGLNSADALHAHVEAKKLAFADAAQYYADPQFVTDTPLEGLISKEYAAQRRALIGSSAALNVDPGSPPQCANLGMPALGDTTYIAVASGNGDMISLIQSNYNGFGSKLVVGGFALQDRGSLFTLDDSHANVYAPRKRHSSESNVLSCFTRPSPHIHLISGARAGLTTPLCRASRFETRCLGSRSVLWAALCSRKAMPRLSPILSITASAFKRRVMQRATTTQAAPIRLVALL